MLPIVNNSEKNLFFMYLKQVPNSVLFQKKEFLFSEKKRIPILKKKKMTVFTSTG